MEAVVGNRCAVNVGTSRVDVEDIVVVYEKKQDRAAVTICGSQARVQLHLLFIL